MLDNRDRASYGCEAIRAGTPDFDMNSNYHGDPDGVLTDAGDTVANILHHCFCACRSESLDAREQFALSILDSACVHFKAELRGEL